jgi:hypothetical protein
VSFSICCTETVSSSCVRTDRSVCQSRRTTGIGGQGEDVHFSVSITTDTVSYALSGQAGRLTSKQPLGLSGRRVDSSSSQRSLDRSWVFVQMIQCPSGIHVKIHPCTPQLEEGTELLHSATLLYTSNRRVERTCNSNQKKGTRSAHCFSTTEKR